MRPAVRAAILAAAIVACGPRDRGTPNADATRPALAIVAPDAATLDRTIAQLTPLGGHRLAPIRFAAGEPWPTAVFAERGLRADAPLGLAITADLVEVRWATVGDADRLGAALDAVRGAARWRTEDGGALWRIADAIAVITGDRVAIVSGGPPSGRERTALELASGALDVATATTAGGLRMELDGSFLIELLLPDPGPVFGKLGEDLGRISLAMVATPDRVAFELDVHPTADTLAEHLVAGSNGRGIVRPEGLFAFTTRVSRDEAIALLSELGPRRRVNVMAIMEATKYRGPMAITGDLVLAPKGVSVRFSDYETWDTITHGLGDLTENGADNAAVFGAHPGSGAGGGLNLHPEDFAITPPTPPTPPAIPSPDDDNTDVPWSEEYRDARKAFETAIETIDRTAASRRYAMLAMDEHWSKALGAPLAIPLTKTATGGYHGAGTWVAAHGSIAATVAAADAEYAPIPAITRDLDAAYARGLEARRRALEIRAHDVSTWDRQHPPK